MFRKNKVSLFNNSELKNLEKFSKSKNIINKFRLYKELSKCSDDKIKEYINSIYYEEDLAYSILWKASGEKAVIKNKTVKRKILRDMKRISKNMERNKKILNKIFRTRKEDKKGLINEYEKGINDIYTFMEDDYECIFDKLVNHELTGEQINTLNNTYKYIDTVIESKTKDIIDDLTKLNNIDKNIKLIKNISKDLTVENDHFYFYNKFTELLCKNSTSTDNLFKVIKALINEFLS